jgi:hypothetical protein
MKTILVTTSSFATNSSRPLEIPQKGGYQVVDNPFGRKLTEEELRALLNEHGPIGLLAGIEPITRSILEGAKGHLRIISRVGVGLENESLEEIRHTYRFCLKMKAINPVVDIAGPYIFRLYPGSPIYDRLIGRYGLNMPNDLESWADYLKNKDTYTEMPWVPVTFQKITKLVDFYSLYALSSFPQKIRIHHKIIFSLWRKLGRIRLRYLFLRLPFEYWIHFVLRNIYKTFSQFLNLRPFFRERKAT